MNQNPNIAILILAAGESSRMGERIKQLLPWGDSTLLGNTLEQAKKSKADNVYIVLGAHAEAITKETDLQEAIYIENPDWPNGMGSSIKTGVQHILAAQERCDAILIMLADQPLMDSDYLDELIDTWRTSDNTIVATAYENRAGVPAIFGSLHFSELQKLNKDYGAKHMLNKSDILVLDPKGKEVDVDTWEAYQQLFNN